MKKPHILIVDDEEDVRERLENILLNRIDCKVEKACDGKEALCKLKTKFFDLVVLDIKMPGLSGIDVINEAVKFTPKTRILAISAYDSQEIADQALKAGATDFIHKPQTSEGIGLKVKDILTKLKKYKPR